VPSDAETCAGIAAAILPIAEQGDELHLASEAGASAAFVLARVRRIERAVQSAESSLAVLPPASDTLGRAAQGVRAALGEARTVFRATSDALEIQVREVTPLVDRVLAEGAELDRACAGKRKDDDCALAAQLSLSIAGTTFGSAGSVASLREALAKAASKTARLNEVRARALVATSALEDRLRQFERALEPQAGVLASRRLGAQVRAVAQTCGARTFENPLLMPADTAASWLVAPTPDLRKLTVVVHVKPAEAIAHAFVDAAATESDPARAGRFSAAAAGAFGSGFVVVRQVGGTKRVYVVTNRHVVDLADEAEVATEGGRSFKANIRYVDAEHDLAVLELPAASFDVGLGLDTDPARDQQVIIATGFPGLSQRPSYQTTRGYISNQALQLSQDGRRYLQHTAPIDRGSSGGPLTTERGRVVGVNTIKVLGRENVGLAVPSRYVAHVIDRADRASGSADGNAPRLEAARDACLDFVGEMSRGKPRADVLLQRVSNGLTYGQGFESLRIVSPMDPPLAEYFQVAPVESLRLSVVKRVVLELSDAQVLSSLELCDRVRGDAGEFHFSLRTRKGHRDISFRLDRGHYRLAGFEFQGVGKRPEATNPKPTNR
jgi:serine protease Do